MFTGIYFLSLLPAGALNGLLPRLRFRNPFGLYSQRRRRRYRHREPYYDDYHGYGDYDDYDYGYHHGPPRDHHNRRLRHGPPLFNKRMIEAYSSSDKPKISSRNNFNAAENSFKHEGLNTISHEGPTTHHHASRIVKRQAVAAPW